KPRFHLVCGRQAVFLDKPEQPVERRSLNEIVVARETRERRPETLLEFVDPVSGIVLAGRIVRSRSAKVVSLASQRLRPPEHLPLLCAIRAQLVMSWIRGGIEQPCLLAVGNRDAGRDDLPVMPTDEELHSG